MTTRQPLAPIAIPPIHSASLYGAPASPISLPVKRTAPASPSRPIGEPVRKVSRTDKGKARSPEKVVQNGSVERDGRSARSTATLATPEIKRMAKEQGMSASPARRLFENLGESSTPKRSGLSGVSTLASTPILDSASPFLARSPPLRSPSTRAGNSISTSPIILSPPLPVGSTDPDENGAVRSIHDCGFSIHRDTNNTPAYVGVGIGTPESKRAITALQTRSLPASLASSPSSTSTASTRTKDRLENQENIPPSTLTTPSSHRSGKPIPGSSHSASAKSGSSKSSIWDEEDTLQPDNSDLMGVRRSGGGISGGAVRRNGRSKLMQELLRKSESLESISAGLDPAEDENGEGEELTPGRRATEDRAAAKAAMTREADKA